MCGLIGMIHYGMRGFDMAAKDALVPLMLLNSMRGIHSTGLFGVEVATRGDKKVDKLAWIKKTGSPYNLMLENDFRRFSHMMYNDFHLVVGHGRYATRGDVSAYTAHPFVGENIALVHNGTLSNLWNFDVPLTDGTTEKADKFFDVDSAAAAYFLETMSPDEFFKTIRGSFAMMWYDRRTKRLNVVRNYERPLFLIHRGGHTPGIFFSSEKESFEYLRVKFPGLELEEAQEIATNTLYSFPIGEGKPSVETRKLEFYSYTAPYQHHQRRREPDAWDIYDSLSDAQSRAAAERWSAAQRTPNADLVFDSETNTYVHRSLLQARRGKLNVVQFPDRKDTPLPGVSIKSIKANEHLFKRGDWELFYPRGFDEITTGHQLPDKDRWWSITGTSWRDEQVEVNVNYRGSIEQFKNEVLLAIKTDRIYYLGSDVKHKNLNFILRLLGETQNVEKVPDDICNDIMNDRVPQNTVFNEMYEKESAENAIDEPFVRLKNGDQMPMHRFEDVAVKGCARCQKQIDVTDAAFCLTVQDGEATGRPVSPTEKAHGGLYCPDCVTGGFTTLH